MDSLNSKLTPIDEYNFNCSTHNCLYIGVCGNYLCKERRLLCMQCVKSNKTCITQEKHELISLSEFFYKFFLKQENKALDIEYLNSSIEMIADIDKGEILKGLKEFHEASSANLNKNSEALKNKFEASLTELKCEFEAKFFEFQSFLNQWENEGKVNKEISNPDNKVNIIEFSEDGINSYEKFKEILEVMKHPLMKLLKKEEITQENLINILVDKEEEIPESSANCRAITENHLTEHNSTNLKKQVVSFITLLNNSKSFSEEALALVKFNKLNEFLDNFNYEKFEQTIDKNLVELEALYDSKIKKIEEIISLSKEEVQYMKPAGMVKFQAHPENFVYIKDLTDTAHVSNSIDSVFCAFKTLKGESLLAWGTPGHTIEIFDFKQNKIIKSIKSAHTSTIFSCRNYVDNVNSNDLIITSSYDRSIKVWSYKENWNNIVNIQNASNGNYIYSVSILSDKYDRKNFVISSCPCEYMKVWDFSGKLIREFATNTESTYFIDCWYYNKTETYYVINANSVDVKSYNFKTGLLYKSYKTTPSNWHMSALVNQLTDVVQLIESDGSGTVRIWDFHSAVLLKSIPLVLGYNLRGICLWNDKYLFAAGSDCHIKLFDIKSGTFIKDFKSHSKTACSIQKILHPQYGECFITHALDGKLKLWAKSA